ncbi:hypothetical protein AWZ03_000920 [Drosophila navojoa]|uniref:Uncharacterized protein n=1 Tax=Drosophila navojoa TaxID=7232 RepID=A0A484BV40_DRONA|nr:hypothetical protein AWZ03_000920 [Drosophila navojoa]
MPLRCCEAAMLRHLPHSSKYLAMNAKQRAAREPNERQLHDDLASVSAAARRMTTTTTTMSLLFGNCGGSSSSSRSIDDDSVHLVCIAALIYWPPAEWQTTPPRSTCS